VRGALDAFEPASAHHGKACHGFATTALKYRYTALVEKYQPSKHDPNKHALNKNEIQRTRCKK
jgi:hypothetical protein